MLSSQTLHELRVACAAILKETGPSGAEYDAIINQPDPLQTYQKEVAKVRSKASATQQSNFVLGKPPKPKEKKTTKDGFSANQSSTTLPINLPFSSSAANAGAIKSSSTLPLPDRREEVSPLSEDGGDRKLPRHPAQIGEDTALANIRAAMDLRPKTSAAACVDYPAFSANSSRSTSRSYQTNDPHRVSTGMTSFAQTPADEKRISNQLPRRAASSDGPQGKYWTTKELSRLSRSDLGQPDFTVPNPDYMVPTLYPRLPPSRQSTRERSRSRSRAGSIAEGIRDGIRDYIRPRPSFDYSRSQSRLDSRSGSRAESRFESRSESRAESRSSSRPASRGSTASTSRNWFRNAATGLRRKGSWSSFRSNRPEDDEQERSRGRDKGPDLNRSLPPLPGLDQYKEPKMHIAQLMAHVPQTHPNGTIATAEGRPYSPGMAPPHDTLPPRLDSLSPTAAVHNPHSRPRIPFADDYPGTLDLGQPSGQDYRIPLASPHEAGQPRGSQEKSHRSRTQDEHRERRKPDHLTDEEFEKRREQELRRVVREKMRNGGIVDEDQEYRRMADAKKAGGSHHGHHSKSDNRDRHRDGRTRERRKETEEERAARKRMEAARHGGRDHAQSRASNRTQHEEQKRRNSSKTPEPSKKGLKNRLSKLLHGGGGSQGHGRMITTT